MRKTRGMPSKTRSGSNQNERTTGPARENQDHRERPGEEEEREKRDEERWTERRKKPRKKMREKPEERRARPGTKTTEEIETMREREHRTAEGDPRDDKNPGQRRGDVRLRGRWCLIGV
jgi:hypothetical protein